MVRKPRRPARRKGPKNPPQQPWCVIAWIIWHPQAHAALQPPTPNLPGPAGPLRPARQGHEDRIRVAIRKVNRLFRPCQLTFNVCEMILLDTSQMTVGNQSMAGVFGADGTLTIGGSHPMPTDFLNNFMTNGPAAFNAKMRERCVHLFFVHDLRYEGVTIPEQGVGGSFGAAGARTCYAMVSARATNLSQTIAHELAHALGINDHSTAEHNLMKETLEDDDTALDGAQCGVIAATLAAQIRRGCP